MNKLLIICGPTATGKTGVAINLAKKFNGEIISADSRQVYKGLSILTGKDLPPDSTLEISKISFKEKEKIYHLPVYLVEGVRIWMYDVVDLGENFSAAHFSKLARLVISDIQKRGKLPIVVGGTGFYISSLIKKVETINIAPNALLRQKLSTDTVSDLQNKLQALDPKKLSSMNKSDRANPRRLIRAIEVITWMKHHSLKPPQPLPGAQVFWVGLSASLPILKARIGQRVRDRWQNGATHEVAALGSLPINSLGLGVGILQKHLTGALSQEESIKQWEKEEFNYAKRQLTWFRKETNIHWYDITRDGYAIHITKDIKAWYTENI